MIDRRTLLLIVLTLSGLYLYAFPAATIPYLGLVLLHVALGVLLTILVPARLLRIRSFARACQVAWICVAAGAVLGTIVIFTGATRPFAVLLDAHIGASAIGVVLLAAGYASRRSPLSRWSAPIGMAALALVSVAVAASAWDLRVVRWRNSHRIENPAMPPESQDYEGDGVNGPFFPSSAQTSTGNKIPAKFFMDSKACQRCHADIYEQWNSSMHHFSSFNNQWYRKSIEYMQDVIGVKPSKWCAGCHDTALLLSGKFDSPIRETVNTPEAQAGLGCVMCHSIASVKSTMGQGDYTLEYPALAELAASDNKVVQALHDFLVYVNPEPHRRVFLKPFLRTQQAEFCSTCHKVHLDQPVNSYRWMRGFNEYDNWQASGISGMGARSFYYPPKSQTCVDCHMPLQHSSDAGNINGQIHSHRFPGANTAVPFANQDSAQLDAVTRFLQDKNVSVDIFGISPARSVAPAGVQGPAPELSTAFAVGEEADSAAPPAAAVEAAPLTAPLNRVDAVVEPGKTYRVDVVVRTRKVGHFFPGGTVDAFDVWLELQAKDDAGRTIFWSGMVEDNGEGPVEPGAHFYRSLQVDAKGNPINKRNAWSARSVVYVRLIPPGAADTVHYRLSIPPGAQGKIHLAARVQYRKFMWWNTQFAFAGERAPGAPEAAKDYDDAKWVFTGDASKTSGKIKAIPSPPIVTLAEDAATLTVTPNASAAAKTQLDNADWTRWNDYGIGLLLQGDLKGAEAAFTMITRIAPNNPDGWVNIARTRIQEGDIDRARAPLDRALQLSPKLARAHFFCARVLKEQGAYDDALSHLNEVLAQYPADRVALNEAGRILFLQKKYAQSVQQFEKTLKIDPEDLQAHYNLMLAYNGLGQKDRALEHQKRYLRLKADEASQAITGPYRMAHPEDNNERQAIHEHVSAPLAAAGGAS